MKIGTIVVNFLSIEKEHNGGGNCRILTSNNVINVLKSDIILFCFLEVKKTGGERKKWNGNNENFDIKI